MKATILLFLLIILAVNVSALSLCDQACQDKYSNWTSYGTFSMSIPANESFSYTAVIDKIPELYNGLDNRLMKLTVAFDWGLNDKYGIPISNSVIYMDSIYDGLPSFQISTTNQTFCPDWMNEGVCTFNFEVNKTYADSSVRSETILIVSISTPWYYTGSVNLYNPPKIISYLEEIGINNTINYGTEGEKVKGYIRNFLVMGTEILNYLFWIIIILSLVISVGAIFFIFIYFYNWIRREFLRQER